MLLLAWLLALSPLSSAKPSSSPIEHSTSSYPFHSVGKPTSALASGCAGSVDEDSRPVMTTAAQLRGLGFGSVHGKHGESEGAASAGGHANSAAQWGIRTQEWGSSGSGSSAGYNQLVFDDNDTGGGNQQRIHLKTSQYASELSLGHLVHTADNYRGALRGQGFELRTDAYGAIRGGSGLHLSTYPIRHSASTRDPAGDNSAALSLLKQAKVLSEAFSQAAGTHATVKLAVHEGSIDAKQSAIDEKASPLPALYQASATQVSTQSLAAAYADAPEKRTTPDARKLPHSGEPILTLAGKGGLALVAGQSLQWSNSETLSLMSGQDSQSITGGSSESTAARPLGSWPGRWIRGKRARD
jgi:type VI secretion system secreted protein VgrG